MDDLQQFRTEIKRNIEILIENNSIMEAREILKHYETAVKDDIDIYSIKGIIAMVEGNLAEAERILKLGVSIHPKNFDLLYNLAYIYQSIRKNELAIRYYKRALQNANIEDDANEVYEILKELGIKESMKEIVENVTADTYYNIAVDLEAKGNKSDAAINYGLAYRNSKNKHFRSNLFKIYDDNKALKNIFDAAAKGKKRNFIILSSCDWGDVYQRMHHIARSLIKLGNEVHYITPSAIIDINTNNIAVSDLTKHSYENLRLVDGVKIYPPIKAVYNGKNIANNYVDLVQSLIDSATESEQTVVITYMPYQVEIVNSLKGNFIHIYECVDDHSDLEYAFWGNKKDIVWEQELMDNADAITTTSTALYLQRRAIEGRENVYLSRNAVNEGDFIFTGEEEIPQDLKNIPEPRIVYTGAVYEWFDSDLFYQVVKSNPDKSFVVIGFGKDDILKEKCPNLYILGPKKHSELKLYLKHMSIGIIPFKGDTDIIVNCDAIKLYEYIACGLPVITTYMPEAGMDKIYTFLANNIETFNEAIKISLNLQMDKETISNFLAENSWNARASLLCNIAENKISGLEKGNLVDDIDNKLSDICVKYNSPIFETLKGMSLNLKDSREYKQYISQAYNQARYKYIERQYLTALFLNNDICKFIEIVRDSKNINNELKEELTYAQNINNKELINIMLNLCIGKVKEAITLVNNLTNDKLKNLYKLYIRFILGEEVKYKEVELITSNTINTPLSRFLLNEEKINKKSITILIPTKDRPELLERCVKYFYNLKHKSIDVHIFILDASNDNNISKNKMLVTKFRENVKHFMFNETSNHFFRILSVSSEVETEFCCICADDDFIHEDGMVKSIEILSKNKDVVTVKGKSYIFLNNDTSKLYYFPKDSCLPLTEEHSIQRLQKLVENWVPQLYYLVYRKKDLYNIIKFVMNNKNKINASVFEEYLFYFLVVLHGKVINVDEPLNIRDESPTSGGYLLPGFHNHTINGDFNKHYINLRAKLLEFCIEKNIDATSKEIDKIFSHFLINSWGVDEKYVKITGQNKPINSGLNDTDYCFDLNLLKQGFAADNKVNIVENTKPYSIVFFEICGKCNAKCKWCVTGNNNINGKRSGSFVNVEDFKKGIIHMKSKKIIDGNTRISLYNWGEPLLHPQFEEIIDFLDNQNLFFALSTNGSKVLRLKGENKRIFKNLTFITFSMPGFSQLSYDKIHGFSFEKIKSNIVETLKVLRDYGFKGKAQIAYHVYQFNIHEIPLAKEFAKINQIDIECSYAYINDYERTKKYLRSSLDYEELKQMGEEIILYPYQKSKSEFVDNYVCPQYDYLVINEKLEIELCCITQKVIGNLMELDLDVIKHIKSNNAECDECHKLKIDYIAHNPIAWQNNE